MDCRCDTLSDGTTRYQCPSTIAPHAPPSRAAELRKLATVSNGSSPGAPADTSSACALTATSPDAIAVHNKSGRILAHIRPIVAQYTTRAASAINSAAVEMASTVVRSVGEFGLSAKPTAIIRTAVPAVKRTNFTPASLPTHASTRVTPTPR